jgi:hypothetical protein
MLPILFTIPPLPGAYLLPLLLVTFVVAALFSVRSARQLHAVPGGSAEHADAQAAVTFPLFVAAFLSVLFWIWSRNPIKLHSYGLFLILGFAVAVWSACREAKRRGRDYNIILDLSIPLLVASVVMCRIVYIALDPGQFTSVGQMVRLWDGGLSFHGSLVAAPAVVWFYAWRNKMSFGELADIIAPSVFLGYGVARLGCFFNGCCYGAVCELPWAVQFHAEGPSGGSADAAFASGAALFVVVVAGVLSALCNVRNCSGIQPFRRTTDAVVLCALCRGARYRRDLSQRRDGSTVDRQRSVVYAGAVHFRRDDNGCGSRLDCAGAPRRVLETPGQLRRHSLPTLPMFPPVEHADEDGLLAIGGDLSSRTLHLAYSRGIFPWPVEDLPLLWFAPPQRGILFCD